jgi:two-component system, NarL family, response regulator LiaR
MINVIIADDHMLVREGLQRILESEEDINCVGTASDGLEALDLIKQLSPDIAIIDVKMPKMDGVEATRLIKENYPNVGVIILSAYDYSEYVFASLENGADGYILKDRLPAIGLLNAIRLISIGTAVMDSKIRKMICSSSILTKRHKNLKESCLLAPREIEILQLASAGMSNKQISIQLSISNQTVGTHFANIFKKLDVQSRMEAVLLAIQKGWIAFSREEG